MSYRDDLAAAHARIADLEDQVARLTAASKPKPKKPSSQTPSHRQVLSRVYYHHANTYVPQWRLIGRAIVAGVPRIPRPETESLLGLILYWIASPVLWLLGNAALYFLAVPYLVLLSLLATPLIAVGVFLTGLRVGRAAQAGKRRQVWETDFLPPGLFALFIAVTLGGAIGMPVFLVLQAVWNSL